MDEDEIRKSAALEDTHWWYAGRRAMLRSKVAALAPGRALDVGAGSGGNTAMLRDLGWDVTALEWHPAAAELARERRLRVVRGDATRLPFADATFDLVMSTDVWEHVEDDLAVSRETFRVTRPGGRILLSVPAGMDLWSGHDVALGHVRRYERADLVELVEKAGFVVTDVGGWNVLLRPVARARRNRRHDGSESEMEPTHPILNAALRSVVRLESHLPVQDRRGVSLVVRGHRPES